MLDAFNRASAPVELLTFWRFTSIWLAPGSSSAGRFSADMFSREVVVCLWAEAELSSTSCIYSRQFVDSMAMREL